MRHKRLIFLLLVLSAVELKAGSATWNVAPPSNDWNKASNWTPETVPSSDSDIATFGASDTTKVMCGLSVNGTDSSTVVGGIEFLPGANTYAIRVATVIYYLPALISIEGQGIINNSGTIQNFVAANSGGTISSGRIYFLNSASAGDQINITNEGGDFSSGDGQFGGFTQFWDNSSAGNATVTSEGGNVIGSEGGFAALLDSSGCETATFISNPGQVSGGGAGYTALITSGDIGNSTFITNAASVPGAEGGWLEYDSGNASGANFLANGSSVAGAQAGQLYLVGGSGYATFKATGGTVSAADGGLIDIFFLANSDQSFVIAEAGTNGGSGGKILIEGSPTIDLARFQVFGNGLVDLSNVSEAGIPIGSFEGDGLVALAGHNLSAGNNNLDTTFSGTIQDSGSLVKVGTGTLTLASASTYNGQTSITSGTLLVTNLSGSATGTGPVNSSAGTLGGYGIISGSVTLGDGSATLVFLQPSATTRQPSTLTIGRRLTFKADSRYICLVKGRSRTFRNDQVIARGVAIEPGAQFDLNVVGNKPLQRGQVFTVISNTSASLITGAFANLDEGAIIAAGRNKLQASYVGGDGNDLTLTVVR